MLGAVGDEFNDAVLIVNMTERGIEAVSFISDIVAVAWYVSAESPVGFALRESVVLAPVARDPETALRVSQD